MKFVREIANISNGEYTKIHIIILKSSYFSEVVFELIGPLWIF